MNYSNTTFPCVYLVKKQLLDNPQGKFVIPDVRFENEANMLRSIGGYLWRVKRGDDPEWWTTAQHQMRQVNSNKGAKNIAMTGAI